MRSLLPTAAAFFVLACSRPSGTPSAPAAGSAMASAPTPSATTAPSVEPSLPVGLADSALPSDDAVKANDAAFTKHKSANYAEAAAGFRRATELSPSFVLARYNLACALARLGDMPGAATELGAVFEVDWIGFRVQADADADLAAFWTSAEGKKVHDGTAALDARYRASIERGLRALLWRSKKPGDTEPSMLRIGVWDRETKRFVPTTARRSEVISAFVASELSYGVLVTGSIPSMVIGDMGPHVTVKDVSYWPYATDGKPLALQKVDTAAVNATLRVAGAKTSLEVSSASELPGRKTRQGFEAYNGTFEFSPEKGTSQEFFQRMPVQPENTRELRGTMELGGHNGFVSHTRAAGYTWKTRTLTLPDGHAIELPKELAFSGSAPSIAASPDATSIALSWDTHRCDCGDPFQPGAHRIVRVDATSGVATKIAEGTGVGAVRFDAAGHLFVQRDRKVTEGTEELPEGVLLVPPVAREADIQCCGF